MTGCGCDGRPSRIAVVGAGLGPNHRYAGGGVVLEGAVGPEVAQGRAARNQAVIPGVAGQVAQAINGIRSRSSWGDHRLPVAIPSRTSLHDVDIDRGDPVAARLPPEWWQVWDGEYNASAPPGVA